MIDLKFTVDGQRLIRNDKLIIANKSKNFISAVFEFLNETDEIKQVLFSDIEKTYICILDENNRCMIPWEVMRGSFFKIGVIIGDRLTTNALKVIMEHSNYTDNLYPSSSANDGLVFIIEELKTKANINHSHEIIEINNLSEILDNKSDIGHTHDFNSLNDIPNSFEPSPHLHIVNDVTDFEDNLDADLELLLLNLTEKVNEI